MFICLFVRRVPGALWGPGSSRRPPARFSRAQAVVGGQLQVPHWRERGWLRGEAPGLLSSVFSTRAQALPVALGSSVHGRPSIHFLANVFTLFLSTAAFAFGL